jgi:hypothetical protein
LGERDEERTVGLINERVAALGGWSGRLRGDCSKDAVRGLLDVLQALRQKLGVHSANCYSNSQCYWRRGSLRATRLERALLAAAPRGTKEVLGQLNCSEYAVNQES